MAYITGGKITGNFGTWGTYRIRRVDFGTTNAPVVDISGTDSTDVREYLEPDLAETAEVTVTCVFDPRANPAVPPLHITGTKSQTVTFTLQDGSTIGGTAIGLRVMGGTYEINQEVLFDFVFQWKAMPTITPGP